MNKSYSQLSTAERWHWHAEVYAFRRVVLGVPVDQRTSPCDENGQWFDPELIDAAEHRMRDKRRAETLAYQRQRDREDAERGWFKDQRTARQVTDEWAQTRGYADIDEYVLAERIDWSEACTRVAISILARMPIRPDDIREQQAPDFVCDDGSSGRWADTL